MDYEKKLTEARKHYLDYMKTLDSIEDKNSTAAIMLTGSISSLELLFPELKESEDERIRKELICYFEKYPSIVIGPFNTKECIAWLEKQGKQFKECMYSKDNYTDEDRKVLCDGCDEDCVILNDCVCAIQAANEVDYTPQEKERLTNRLRSIIRQKQWKPSKEQLQALRWVCNRTFIAQEPQKESALEDLYEQLMAL